MSERLAKLMKMLEADANDAFVLYGVAQEYAKQGDTARAVEFYDRCLAGDPLYCYAYFHKARTLQDAGRDAEAVETVKVGLAAAKRAQDGHAASELQGLLDELE